MRPEIFGNVVTKAACVSFRDLTEVIERFERQCMSHVLVSVVCFARWKLHTRSFDPSVVYSASVHGSVYRSTDLGK
jgi:hypothetical protein